MPQEAPDPCTAGCQPAPEARANASGAGWQPAVRDHRMRKKGLDIDSVFWCYAIEICECCVRKAANNEGKGGCRGGADAGS